MDPNDQNSKPSDQEIKDAARNGRSTRPGVVPVNEAAALDQRIAEKTRSVNAAPKELDQLERDVSSKQKNAPDIAAATPGAYSSQPAAALSARSELSDFESDVAAKQRARPPPANAVDGLDRKVAAKMAAASGGNRDLKNLEASVQAKMNANGGISQQSRDSSSMQQYDHGATDAKSTPRDDLSRLDERIAAKSGVAVPRSLQETETIVTKKASGTMQGSQTTPQDKSLPVQNPQNAKEDLTLDSHPQGLQPHGDVEYGEFGGPTEQGLAVAFAVEEETEDAFIPAAIEYDPDAKPPLIKNRRFRLYAFLAIIVVLVGTISAAVGLTLAGKKLEHDLTERDVSGVREAIEKVFGVEKLADPSSPYFKALKWIMDHDPLQLLPSDDTFVQRFVIVLFYYSTSVKREWDGGCAPAVQGETDDCDFEYLIESYEGAEQIMKITTKRWLSGGDECTWAGIQCSDDKHIRSIDLSGANMTGTVPDELDQLIFLQSFSVKFNELGGPLPEKLSKLRHLVDLNLFANEFTGTIPESFFTTPTLQRLNLALNNLNGTISTSVGEMVDAKGLFLSFNQLTGTLPTEIGRLHSVVNLWLHGNAMNGTIPTEIGTLYRVEGLLLNRNLFFGGIPTEIGQLTNLGDLKLSENQLTGQIPSQLFGLKYLYNLDLFKNQLNGTIDPDIANMTALDNLRLYFNDFSGTIPSTLGVLTDLDNIQVFGNRFNGSIPIEFCPAQRGALNLSDIPRLVADCLPGDDGSPPEIECECCSNCCDRDTENCLIEI